MSQTKKADVAYGDTRGTKNYWRDPRDPMDLPRRSNNDPLNRSLPASLSVTGTRPQKAMDIYDPSMEPEYGETKTIIKEV